jgi:hypothetical protein
MIARDCKANDYLKFVQTSKLHVYAIQDEGILPHNKKDLLDAIYWRLKLDFRKNDAEVLSTLALSLANYQEGVGATCVHFTDTSEVGLKFKHSVNEELVKINAELTRINKTRDESHEEFERQYNEHINRHSKGTSLYAYFLLLILLAALLSVIYKIVIWVFF